MSVYRMGQPAKADVFVVLLARGEFAWRHEFSSFSKALNEAQRHVSSSSASDEPGTAEVWFGERLMLWDSTEREYDHRRWLGPLTPGRYRYEFNERGDSYRFRLALEQR